MSFIELRSAHRSDLLRTLIELVLYRRAVSRSRKVLANLESHQLQDIGISAEQARKEAARPIWDAPMH